MIQEIITDYNIKIFIQKGVYATFRFQSCDSKGRAQDREDIKNSYSLSKENQKKIVTGVNFRLKSTIRSNLRKFLRLKFWVEFLIKIEEKKVDFMKEEIESSDSEEKIMIKENITKKETNHRVISVNEDIKLEINEEEKENSGNFDKYNNKYNKEEEKYIEEEED